MKIRGLLIATAIFCALAGTLYWSEHRKAGAEASNASSDATPAILKLDQAAITAIAIKKKDADPVQLAKTKPDLWQITAPKPMSADQSSVSGMLSSLSTLNSERVVEDKAGDLKRYGLDQPSLEVDVTEKGNKSQKLLVGDDTPAGSAVYAMLAGDPRIFTMASYSKNSVDKTVNDLRDKRLITLSVDKISRLELIRKNQDIEFGRNKDDWQILKPKPLRADSYEVGELARKVTDARMDLSGADSDKQDPAAAFARATPIATAKVTDPSGTQELQVRKDKDTYYARSSAVDGVYKVASDLGQSLDKGLEDFRNKKLFDFGFTDPNKIELHNGVKAYFLTRGGQDWWSNGKKMDSESVQDLISKTRDLTASKFVDSGFTTPVAEITVTSEEGKRTEKVLISKSGDAYIAKRESEPALYQLAAAGVDQLLKAADAVKPAVSAPSAK